MQVSPVIRGHTNRYVSLGAYEGEGRDRIERRSLTAQPLRLLEFRSATALVSSFCNPVNVAELPRPRRPPSSPRNQYFIGEKLGRNQHCAPIQAWRPTTKPDYAFEILGCCETLQDNETHRRAS